MTRLEQVHDVVGNWLVAADVTRLISELIAQEIESYAGFMELEGDVFELGAGLRKAAEIARQQNGSRNNE